MSGKKAVYFGVGAMKSFPELIPLFGIMGVACVGAAGYSVYALSSKSDVNLTRSEIPPWERVNPEKKQKLMVLNTEYKKNPELEELRQQIGSYKS